MTSPHDDAPAVIETRVVHDTHRRATSVLADAFARSDALPSAVVELRDFVVAALEHHHECEDEDLWPLLSAAAPDLAEPLAALSREHEYLDDALRRLSGAPVGERDDGQGADAARAVRDLVHEHLAHEEPILFPALRTRLSDEDWGEFSRRTIASTPPVGTHLMIGFFHDVAPVADVEVILRQLPEESRQLVPVLRERARSTLAGLGGAMGSGPPSPLDVGCANP